MGKGAVDGFWGKYVLKLEWEVKLEITYEIYSSVTKQFDGVYLV